ncbi:hypothetical protein [Algibacter mikhailovii]|nr:hypothetical protein [Algibacter mikhailovii]
MRCPLLLDYINLHFSCGVTTQEPPLKTDSKNLTITGASASVLEERYALGTDSRTLIFGFDENHIMGLYAVKGDQSKWHHLVP